MNKSDIDAILADRHDLTEREMDSITDGFLQLIMKAVSEDGEADLHRFGTFEKKVLKARTGRNPQTGEALQIPESLSVKFRPWKAFKEFLNP